jgi:hypothetical protein
MSGQVGMTPQDLRGPDPTGALLKAVYGQVLAVWLNARYARASLVGRVSVHSAEQSLLRHARHFSRRPRQVMVGRDEVVLVPDCAHSRQPATR